MSAARARERNRRYEENLREAEAAALREARSFCADEFEPLWRPAGCVTAIAGVPRQVVRATLERANVQAAAKRAAFAWLSARLRLQTVISNFDQLGDIETLRRAFLEIWNAQLTDVVRWAETQALEAGCDG